MPRTLELTLKRPDKSMKIQKQVPSTAIQKKNARFLGSAAGQKNCPVHSRRPSRLARRLKRMRPGTMYPAEAAGRRADAAFPPVR